MLEKKYISPVGSKGMYILDTASWRTVKPVMDKEKCIECGICLTICPVNAIKGTKEETYYIDYSYCKGCGVCAKECPKTAIEMILEKEGEME